MRSNRIGNIIFAAAVCITFGLVKGDPGTQPDHSEQGDIRHPVVAWYLQQPGEPLMWYLARMRWATREVPRIQNHDTPAGDPFEPSPDGPAEPGCTDC